MKQVWIITLREFKERVRSRSFILTALMGPMVVLALIYLLFTFGGKNQPHWEVLIVDPAGIMENKIMAREDVSVSYSFANNYIEIEEFAKNKRFEKFDALLELNEKVLSNRKAFLFYKQKPSEKMLLRVHYQFERRIEERVMEEFSGMTLQKFRELKQPILLDSRSVYDPMNESGELRGWVGLFFGMLIVIFVLLFGMTIMRSISREKSNRIVEVLLATVKPRELLAGKITGIGFAAMLQFLLWFVLIAGGLYFFRETMFPDLLDASRMDFSQMASEMQQLTEQERMLAAQEYNRFVELVYERISFGVMIGYFLVFFVIGYFFYASIFAGLGAVTGSESDGQQFIIPLVFILFMAVYAGYFAVYNPDHPMVNWMAYVPFSAPVVCLVKIAYGYPEGTSYQLFLSILILLGSTLATLWISGRLYRNGILQFGHRLRWYHLIQWIRRG